MAINKFSHAVYIKMNQGIQMEFIIFIIHQTEKSLNYPLINLSI